MAVPTRPTSNTHTTAYTTVYTEASRRRPWARLPSTTIFNLPTAAAAAATATARTTTATATAAPPRRRGLLPGALLAATCVPVAVAVGAAAEPVNQVLHRRELLGVHQLKLQHKQDKVLEAGVQVRLRGQANNLQWVRWGHRGNTPAQHTHTLRNTRRVRVDTLRMRATRRGQTPQAG